MTAPVSQEVTNDELNQIISIESAGKPLAKASTSSATGLGQFLSQTWLGTLKKYAPSEIAARIVKRGKLWVVPDGGEQEILDLRKGTTRARLKFNVDMLARLTEESSRILGKGRTNGDLYLAHFLGPAAALKVLRANPSDSVEPLVGASAVQANHSILSGKNCAQVRQWASSAMNTRWAKFSKRDWVGDYWTPGEITAAQLLHSPDVDDRSEHPPVKVEHAAPAPANLPHGQRSVEIEVIQRRLTDRGYMPGEIDGLWGGRTRGEIAAFKNDRELTGPAEIDDELTEELTQAENEGWHRPIAPARKNATPEELAPKLPEVAASQTAERTGFWASILTGGGALVTGVSGFIGDAWDWLTKFKDVAGEMPWYGYAIGLFVVAAVLYFISKKAGDAKTSATVAYQEGARV